MKIFLKQLDLPLRHPFTLGNGSSRTHTPISLIYLEHDGIVGIGEAAMPPYLGENHESAREFVNQLDLSFLTFPINFEVLHQYLDRVAGGNTAIKAAVDIALYDWWGKKAGKSVTEILGLKNQPVPITAGTIGITPIQQIEAKIKELLNFGFQKVKVKLGGPVDKESILEIRRFTDLPMTVDVNQGWTDLIEAVKFSFWLADQGVLLLEQPFLKEELAKLGQLKTKSPIPVIADESCQRLVDIERVAPFVDGINIKLMKCSGISEALKMTERAKNLGLITMLGCMTETSCATYAEMAIASQFDLIDVDGPWILKEQPFLTPELANGRIVGLNAPGLGIQ